MRSLLSVSLISLMASGALADEFTLDSTVSAATIYPQGATVVRTMEFDVPAGQHTLLISDIPYEFQRETLQILGGEGLVFGASRVISSRVQPDDLSLARRTALESQIASLEVQITVTQEESAAAGLVINAASARIKLLDSIGNQQAEGAAAALEASTISVETLTALLSLVGSETLVALQDAQAARVEIARINRGAEDLRKQLQNARVEVVRKVIVAQYTGEDWPDATVTVSTSTPFSWGRFAIPGTNLATYETPAPQLQARVRSDQATSFAAPEVVMAEEPAVMAAVEPFLQGVTVNYTLPAGTNIRTDDEGTLITLNSAEYDVDMSARANMGARSNTAYLIAEFVNSSNEPFLPGDASYFRDGAYVANGSISVVAAGATAKLGFGKVDGLTISRTILRREDGSSGVLTTSNDRVVEYEFNIENVTNRTWDVVVYDNVPVSQQEELIVNWSARPRPTETDVEGQRGVLAWAFTLESGNRKAIKLSEELQWPDGTMLRVLD